MSLPEQIQSLFDNCVRIYHIEVEARTQDDILDEERATWAVTDWYLSASDEDRATLRSLAASYPTMMFSWSFGGAVLSVRKNDSRWIRMGLVSLSLENLQTDWRESLCKFSLIGNSARKINCPLDPVIDQVATASASRFGELLRAFFNRPIVEQAIGLMGYRESTDGGGFMYDQLDDEDLPF